MKKIKDYALFYILYSMIVLPLFLITNSNLLLILSYSIITFLNILGEIILFFKKRKLNGR